MLTINQFIQFIKDNTIDYVDFDYSLWLTWCLTPLVVTFLLPVVIALLLYLSAFTLYIYKLHWGRLRTALITGDKWEAARKVVAIIWDAHGWIWHGFSILSDCMRVIPGTVQSCSKLLKEGNYLAIAPGGVYEAQFSLNYSLMWKRRLGFAKAALESKVPVIPIFTENLREAFRTMHLGRRLFLKLYTWTKLPFAPIYGGFPVKMVTHIGRPIYYEPDLSPEDLQMKVAASLEELIKTHQRIPGNILLSILDRIPYLRKRLKSGIVHRFV
ncbi:transmembrane protein 68 isoform X2 [Dendroctonus ponderosae]|uniref:Phospholipid/glycerol acyltransferase domain-containing protein n=1 Tax=Dendroctonus ponderosae TaxID=77166 RepID=A0AAR5NX28_DENPD|nr:transmembrane protein 68 isoform X2 [Dendroctonus ponderosae]